MTIPDRILREADPFKIAKKLVDILPKKYRTEGFIDCIAKELLQAENRGLGEVLEDLIKYGTHQGRCEKINDSTCICGLDKAIKAIRERIKKV